MLDMGTGGGEFLAMLRPFPKKVCATEGYEDGAIGDDPVCPSFDEGMKISFYNPNGEVDYFKITMENENAFGLNGSGMIKTLNCYFERKK